ncbi:hypothetical protein [Streptomyces clavuligerus]|nr:hypothetical protein [Streptomyces clavuligerus]WDN56652.1 hypothetical protein LL058_33065 [Streptomyces clavuligerus]
MALVATALATVLTGGLTAPVAQAAPSAGSQSAVPAAECGVRAQDRRLWCGNHADLPTRLRPYHESPIRGLLTSTFSWFDCWSYGGQHGGGNATWYHTTPDHGEPGWVPADWVFTHSSFDANPSAFGLRNCQP